MDLTVQLLIATFLRLTVPILIIRWPLPGVLLCSYLDLIDYHYLLRSGTDMTHYQTWDKFMDIYYLSFAAYTVFSWRDTLAKKLAIGTYASRLTGVILLSLTGIRQFLLFFPNFFESFFIFYLVFKVFKKQRVFINKQVLLVIVGVILFAKLFQEFSMHFIQKPPTQILDLSILPLVGKYLPRPPENYVQIFIYLLLPVFILVWRVGVKSRMHFSFANWREVLVLKYQELQTKLQNIRNEFKELEKQRYTLKKGH